MTKTDERPTPIRGPLFDQVLRLRVEGQKRRKTLALIAAYADAGQSRPTLDELAGRLQMKPAQVRALIDRLAVDGYLVLHHRRKTPRTRYELTLPEVGAR
jgi:DNA-binding MarR family transcriptional regulator